MSSQQDVSMPLFGKRVLVSRPEPESDVAAAAWAKRGAVPVVIPLISISELKDKSYVRHVHQALSKVKGSHFPSTYLRTDKPPASNRWHRSSFYDGMLFTSSNAVKKWMHYAYKDDVSPDYFNYMYIACIGSETAATARREGLVVSRVANHFSSEGLLAALLEDIFAVTHERISDERPRLLFPRALDAREVISHGLRAAKVDVDVVPVYQTSYCGENELLSALKNRGIDVMTFASSSAIESASRIFNGSRRELLKDLLVACIGPTTATLARKKGLDVQVIASPSTLTNMIFSVENWFRQRTTES